MRVQDPKPATKRTPKTENTSERGSSVSAIQLRREHTGMGNLLAAAIAAQFPRLLPIVYAATSTRGPRVQGTGVETLIHNCPTASGLCVA